MRGDYVRWVLASLLLISLQGCGYHFGPTGLASAYKTVSVPFVQNDPHGELTATLIREITTTGTYTYCQYGGELELAVTLVDIVDENVAYRYEKETRKVKRSTVPSETRLTAIAEVVLVETATGRCLVGPARIGGSVVFDHDYYTSPDAVNVFSLGQLTDIEQAQEAALTPLFQVLARNINEYIRNVW